MTLRALTLDCAGTLIDVRWKPHSIALECAEALGLSVDDNEGYAAYDTLLARRWPEFRELNLQRSSSVCDAFWERITRDWLIEVGHDPALTSAALEVADRLLFGPDSTVFRLFPDTKPALDALKAAGFRLAVLSNWDVSLHKVLRHFELDGYFELEIASLEEGVEKPDARLFEIALDRLGLDASEVGHVGDDPVDDLTGARGAGMRAWLVDRDAPASMGLYVRSLEDLPEAIRSTV